MASLLSLGEFSLCLDQPFLGSSQEIRIIGIILIGSHNRDKQRLCVAKLHEKIANQRRDFLHKKARYLADRYDAIGIEDIRVKAMAKRKKGGKFSFGKSVADNGWNLFTNILEYKLAWEGKQLVRIDKWYPSSQLCHVCGYQNNETKDLSRLW